MDNVFYKRVQVRESFEGAISHVAANIEIFVDREYLKNYPKEAAIKVELIRARLNNFIVSGDFLENPQE